MDVDRGGYNVNHLIEAITIAKTEGSYLKVLNKKNIQIILDCLKLHSSNKNMKLAILQIMYYRNAKKNGDRNLPTACCKLIRIAGGTYTGRCNNGQDDSKKALP